MKEPQRQGLSPEAAQNLAKLWELGFNVAGQVDKQGKEIIQAVKKTPPTTKPKPSPRQD